MKITSSPGSTTSLVSTRSVFANQLTDGADATGQTSQAQAASAGDLVSIGSLVAGTDADNLMARNYLDPDAQESKYITAQLNSFQARQKYADKMGSLTATLAAGIDTDNKYSAALIMRARSERLGRQLGNQAIGEECADDLAALNQGRAPEAAGDTEATGQTNAPETATADATTPKNTPAPAVAGGGSVDVTV